MTCNLQIHTDLISIEEDICPYCDQLLIKGDTLVELCCQTPDLDTNDAKTVCFNCGTIEYHYLAEPLDFYDNMYKINKKSVYHRKYLIENSINCLILNKKICLTHKQKYKIYQIFNKIGGILPDVNRNRKRMIAVNYIIRRILQMMGLSYKEIPISKSEKTLIFYDNYWCLIMNLIGDKIINILDQ